MWGPKGMGWGWSDVGRWFGTGRAAERRRLEERYAKGELTLEQYRKLKHGRRG